MSYKSKELREERAKVAAQMAEIVATARKSESGIMTAEQKQIFDRMSAETDNLKEQIESHERMEKFESSLVEESRTNKVLSPTPPESLGEQFVTWCKAKAGLLSRDEMEANTSVDLRSNRFQSFTNKHYLDRLHNRANEPQSFSLNSGNFGSQLVPTTLADFVSRLQTAVFDVRSICRNITTTGIGNFDVPLINDSANMATQISEASSDVVTPVGTSKTTLSAYAFTSGILQITQEMLMSSNFPCVEFFGEDLAYRIGRGRANALCNGSGSAAPTGYKTGATTIGVNLASNTAVTYAELQTALNAVPLFYRTNASWVVSDSFHQAVRALVDGNGRPIWSVDPYPSATQGNPDRLLGKPVYIDPYLDAMGSNNHIVGVVGDWSNFLVRNVEPGVEVETSAHRYFEKRVLALVSFFWIESKMLQPTAFRAIETIAS